MSLSSICAEAAVTTGRGENTCRTSLSVFKMPTEKLAALRTTAGRTPQASNGNYTETGASNSGKNIDVFAQWPEREYADEGCNEYKRA